MIRRHQAPDLLALLPIAGLITFVLTRWVEVPFGDQFAVLDLLRAQHSGDLTFADFWAQHNEHRLLFPRLVMVGLAGLTHWNTLYEGLATVLFALLGFLPLAISARRERAPWCVPVISVLYFSLAMYENWLWGFQLQIPLCVLGVIVAVFCTSHSATAGWWLLPAGLAGLLATFSFGSGLLVWPICWGILLFQPQSRTRHTTPGILIWTVLSTIVIGAYLFDFHRPDLGLTHDAGRFWNVLRFVGAQIGGVLLAAPSAPARILGYVGIGLFALIGATWFYVSLDRQRATLPFLAIGLFGLLAAVLTGIGRAGSGDPVAVSRYLQFTTLLWIAIVVTPFVWIARMRSGRLRNVLGLLQGSLAACIAVCSLGQVPVYLDLAQRALRTRSVARQAALDGDWANGVRPLARPYRKLIEGLAFLENRRLSLFRAPVQIADRPPDACGIQPSYTPGSADGPGVLELRQPALAGKTYRCLFSLASQPAVRLPDHRQIPLAMDPLYLQSLQPASALFAGHQATFDADGVARIEIRIPRTPDAQGTRIHFALYLVDARAPFSIGRICRGADFRL